MYRKWVSGAPAVRARRPQRIPMARLQGRFTRALDAVFDSHGDVDALRARLGLTPRGLIDLVSRLRGSRLALRVTTWRPAALGRPFECVTLVRLRSFCAEDIDALCGWCIADPAVVRAVQLCGSWDYQLASFHPHAEAAEGWRRELAARAEVAAVSQRAVRTIKGHHAPSPLLIEEAGRYSRRVEGCFRPASGAPPRRR